MEECKMNLYKILKNRINAELKKEENEREFTEISSTLDIFLAGGKIIVEQYTELSELIAE
ncbi:hypothetical protein J4G49_01035 [Clostridium neonatale]|nr:hypothetical protein [Clostridium neonatale]